jgi:Pyruvate/2-oxoacid:ferredoxin oxidoreductase delta subunit
VQRNPIVAVIFCQCKNAQIISPQIRETLTSWFSQNQVAHTCVDDLCGLAAKKDSRLGEWAADENLVVIACFQRAIRWLFAMAGVNLKDSTLILNQRVSSAQEIIGQLKSQSLPAGQRVSISSEEQWIPWFPVIDYSRCTNCRQCLNFCLFGVYASGADGKVEVTRPANCKTGCPACARVCPSAAIIFAKYTESPFNGDTVNEEQLSQLRNSGDFKKWVADNLQKRLQMRNQPRQNAGNSYD